MNLPKVSIIILNFKKSLILADGAYVEIMMLMQINMMDVLLQQYNREFYVQELQLLQNLVLIMMSL